MKTVILISSIFYILGLKVGTNIDLAKNTNSVEKVNGNQIIPKTEGQTFEYRHEADDHLNPDSLKSHEESGKLLDNSK